MLWYAVEDFWTIQKRYSIGRLLFGLLLGSGSLTLFSIAFHLSPSESAIMVSLGLISGGLAYVLNEVTWRSDAPRRIGLSDESLHYETAKQRGHVSFADITRIWQRREAAFGLRIQTKNMPEVFLSVGVGSESAVGRALQERFAKWCLRVNGSPPNSSSPFPYKRWLVLIAP